MALYKYSYEFDRILLSADFLGIMGVDLECGLLDRRNRNNNNRNHNNKHLFEVISVLLLSWLCKLPCVTRIISSSRPMAKMMNKATDAPALPAVKPIESRKAKAMLKKRRRRKGKKPVAKPMSGPKAKAGEEASHRRPEDEGDVEEGSGAPAPPAAKAPEEIQSEHREVPPEAEVLGEWCLLRQRGQRVWVRVGSHFTTIQYRHRW